MSEVKCKLCGLEPLTYEEEEKGYFHEKDVELAEGNYSSLKCVKNSAGCMCIYAVGDDCTEDYFPKFCPECGKKLTKEGKEKYIRWDNANNKWLAQVPKNGSRLVKRFSTIEDAIKYRDEVLRTDRDIGKMNYRAAYDDLLNEIQQFKSCITAVRGFDALIPVGIVADEIDKCVTHSLSIGAGEENEESD